MLPIHSDSLKKMREFNYLSLQPKIYKTSKGDIAVYRFFDGSIVQVRIVKQYPNSTNGRGSHDKAN